MLIDTHCHLDFDAFDEDRDEVVARAAAAGVARIIVPAVHLDNGPTVLSLAERYDGVFAAIGVHPNSLAGWQDSWVDTLRELAQHQKVVAIGEIGLDYYWDRSPKAVQHQALRAQLALAAELELPVIIHNRDSSADVIRLLSESALAGRERPGVLHSFSADWETAQTALEMGYYLGFTGPITYKKAEDLRRIAARVPLERLLVETDAPFLPPQPYRGRRNEPAYVADVADRLAGLHNMATAALAQQTTDNAIRLFGEQLK
ncbi:MAG TPA: TatD family hydrolase [Anaerolineae bacterium]